MARAPARTRASLTYAPGMNVLRYLDPGIVRQGETPEPTGTGGVFPIGPDTASQVGPVTGLTGGATGVRPSGGMGGNILQTIGKQMLDPSNWETAQNLYDALFGTGVTGAGYLATGAEAASTIPLAGEAGLTAELLGQYGGVQGLIDAGLATGAEAGTGALAATEAAGTAGLAAEGTAGAVGAAEGAAGAAGAAGAEAGAGAAGAALIPAYAALPVAAGLAGLAKGAEYLWNQDFIQGHPTVGPNYGAEVFVGPGGQLQVGGTGADTQGNTSAPGPGQAQSYADWFINEINNMNQARGYRINPEAAGQGFTIGQYSGPEAGGFFYGDSRYVPSPERDAVMFGNNLSRISVPNADALTADQRAFFGAIPAFGDPSQTFGQNMLNYAYSDLANRFLVVPQDWTSADINQAWTAQQAANAPSVRDLEVSPLDLGPTSA